MSSIALSPNAAGTAIFTVAAPGTSTDRTITLPDATTTLVGTDATQTLTNKTINGGTVSGATISGSTISGGALTAMTAQNSTSGTFIDFTGIPSWVRRVTVMLVGVSTSASTAIALRLGTSGGLATTGYASQAASVEGTAAASNFSATLFLLEPGGGAALLRNGTFVVSKVTGNTWVMTTVSGVEGAASARAVFGGGSVTLSGDLTQLRVTTTNGTDTFDAGTINVMYEG